VLGRGLAHEPLGEVDKAMDDYTTVLEQTDAPTLPRAEAYYYSGVLRCRKEQIEQGIADLKAAVQTPDPTIGSRASAFFFSA
jgi:hypothetical protein